MKKRKLAAGILLLAFSALLPMTASAATEYREGDPAIHGEGDPTIPDDDYDQITIGEEGETVFYGEYAHGEEFIYGYVDADRLRINLTKPGVLCIQAIADDIVWDCDEIIRIELRSEDFSQPDYYLRRYINGDYETDDWTISDGHGYTRMDMFLDAGQYVLNSISARVTPYRYRIYFYPFEPTASAREVLGSREGYVMRALGEEISGGFTATCFREKATNPLEVGFENLKDGTDGEWNLQRNQITFEVPEDGDYKITLKANNGISARLETEGVGEGLRFNVHSDYSSNTAASRWRKWCMEPVDSKLLDTYLTREKVVELTAGTHTLSMLFDVTDAYLPFYSCCYTVKVEKTEKVVEQKEQTIDVQTSRTEYFYLLPPDFELPKFNLYASAETDLSYVSDNTAVAEVSADGTVTLKSAGTVHIKVTAAETEEYKAAQTTVTINVIDIFGGGTASGGQTGTTGGTTTGSGSTTGSQGTTSGGQTSTKPGGQKPVTQEITVKTSVTKTFGSKAFSLNASARGGAALSYSSSNKKVAVVSKTGKVTLKGMGKATITVKAAAVQGYPAAAAKVTLTVNPKTPTGVKLTALSKKLKVNWKKTSKVKYQIQYTNKTKTKNKPNFTGAKSVSGAKPGAVLKSLKANSKYYVRVRAYSGSGKNRVYSAWSKTVSVKTK